MLEAAGLEFTQGYTTLSTKTTRFIIVDQLEMSCTGWRKVSLVSDGYLHVQMELFWRLRMKQILVTFLTRSCGNRLDSPVVLVIVLISVTM